MTRDRCVHDDLLAACATGPFERMLH
jgi:hypothetical protein